MIIIYVYYIMYSIYIYIFVCARVCVCASVCTRFCGTTLNKIRLGSLGESTNKRIGTGFEVLYSKLKSYFYSCLDKWSNVWSLFFPRSSTTSASRTPSKSSILGDSNGKAPMQSRAKSRAPMAPKRG